MNPRIQQRDAFDQIHVIQTKFRLEEAAHGSDDKLFISTLHKNDWEIDY